MNASFSHKIIQILRVITRHLRISSGYSQLQNSNVITLENGVLSLVELRDVNGQ